MKILILSNFFPPAARGGAELVAHRDAMRLAEAGQNVSVITLAPPDSAPAMTLRGTVRVYTLRPAHVGSVFSLSHFSFARRLLFHVWDSINPFAVAQILAIVQKEQPEVILAHGLKGLSYRVIHVLTKRGYPVVLVPHDVQWIEPSGRAEPAVARTLIRVVWSRWTRWCLGTPRVVAAPSTWILHLLHTWQFFPSSTSLVLRNLMAPVVPHTSRLITHFFFLGQCEEHKGLATLLAAWKEKTSQGHLTIVGDGSFAFPSALDASITRIPKREGAGLAEAWAQADAVIVPSLCAENAPTVIQEAIARGIPVIASAVGGVSELIQPGWGTLVAPGDSAALASAIDTFAQTTWPQQAVNEMIAQGKVWQDIAPLLEILSSAKNV